jgi:hypothetical protein
MANENALRDDNGTPTLIYEESGQTKRVSAINPLPVAAAVTINQPVTPTEKTVTKELTGNSTQTLATPATGKKITIKGCAIILSKSGAIGTLRFNGGTLIARVNKIEHSGNFLPMTFSGAVNEPIVGEQSNAAGADTSVIIVNYIEE